MKKVLAIILLIAFAAPILGSAAYAGGTQNAQGQQGQQGGGSQGAQVTKQYNEDQNKSDYPGHFSHSEGN